MLKKQIVLVALAFTLVFAGCETPTENGSKSQTSKDKVAIQEQNVKEDSLVEQKDEAKSGSQEQKIISSEEQEFNASGRAKAIESESDMWPLFEDKKTGFTLNYPMNTVLVDNSSLNLNSEMPQVRISVLDIGEKVNPWDLEKEGDQKNIEELASGKFGTTGENALEVSKKVEMVGNVFAQDFVVLTRIDMCNVTLERKRLFYFNNKKIEVTGFGSIPKVKELMPEYFTTDKENCGLEKVWDLKKLDNFYSQLINKKAPAEIQGWYDNFDKMMDTVVFLHK
jgi:hypothetical protein